MSSEGVFQSAIAAAVMAPSSHNTQPWRFKIRGDELEVHADPKRQLLVIDRDARQLVTSCGCALMNARIAIRAMGFAESVSVRLMNDDLPLHLATVRLRGRRAPSDIDRSLMSAIGRRSTNRRRFLPRPVPLLFTDMLATLARREGVELVRLEPAQKVRLARLVDIADRWQLADRRYRDELARWLASPRSLRRDGIPFEEKEYGSRRLFALSRTLRSPSLGQELAALEESLVRDAPAVLAFGTLRDDPRAWLACGQALESVLLHLTASGYAAAFANQVLELPDLRQHVHRLVPGIAYPQMIIRVGVPSAPVERVAPRRSIAAVIE